MGVNETNSSVANSALSPYANKTGVVCVWKPVIVFGLPAWPTTSTAFYLNYLINIKTNKISLKVSMRNQLLGRRALSPVEAEVFHRMLPTCEAAWPMTN